MSDEHEPRWWGTGYGGGQMVCRCGDDCEDGYNAHIEATHDAQIRDLLEEREELLTEIRRLRMGNHPAGRAFLAPELLDGATVAADNVVALREALTERDAEHEGGEGA